MSWEIRLGTTADLADIQGLFKLVDGLHSEALPSLFRPVGDIERDQEFLGTWLEDEGGRLWVAVVNGRVVGLVYAKYYERTDHPFILPYSEIYIHEMTVAEAYHGSGVAQALMDEVTEWAKVKGVDRLRLQVFEFNQRAQAFYAKQGFVTNSRHMWREVAGGKQQGVSGRGQVASEEAAPPLPHSPAPLPSLVRPEIVAMKAYTPIVPFEVLSARLGRRPEEIVKLDANENPYGPSPRVRQALAQAAYLHIYPDPEANELREAISEYTNVPKEYLLAGMGADELIDLVLRVVLSPGDGVVDCPPSFGMYPFSTAVNVGQYIPVPRREDFSLDIPAIEQAVAQNPQTKVLFVCSPNNPDGGVIGDEALRRLLALPLLVVLDEAYVEFTSHSSRINWVLAHENLVVLRTFSKLAGLAGLRIGYGAFPQWLLPHLWKVKQPYNVNVAAGLAAMAALQDGEWLAEKVRLIVQERGRLQAALGAFDFLRPYASESNFVLCGVNGRSAQDLKLALEQEGVFVRYFDKPGVDNCIRVSVGRPSDTAALVRALSVIGKR
ncbi:MAG: histidinol-phosphate transaminase [Ardenticatenaceae bacterium]|nr:histidinol-phosphate transaminase [Ardenticatenaceae bacterium]